MKKTEFTKSRNIKNILFFSLMVFLFSCQDNDKKNTEKINGFTHVEWSKDAVIYEVNVRQFTAEGTFAAFEKHLPRLSEMGVDILWLMPINPVGLKNRKGSLGSYYSVKDYKAVNPEYGNMDDFKKLVNEAHKLGMHVILDWVANHTSWDNKMIEEHPEWYTKDSLGNFVSPFDWSDVVDLNYENEEMQEYMIGALKFWIEEANIDGYRCDVAGMVPVEFWDKARAELDKIKPVFMLAEAEEVKHHKNAFDMSYGWDFHHIMNEIAKGNKNANDAEKYFIKNDKNYPEDAYRMYFTSNHDENSWNGTEFERMGDAAKTFAVFSFMIPGMPLIYSGQEAALNKRLAFFEKDTIIWGDIELEKFYKNLIQIKKKNEALWNGTSGGKLVRINSSDNENVFAFVREKNGNKIFAIFNFSGEKQYVTFEGDKFIGEYINAFTGKEAKFSANENLEIEPWGYFVFEGKNI